MKNLFVAILITCSILVPKPAKAFIVPGGYAVGLALAQVGMVSLGVVVFGQALTRPGIPKAPWWMLIPIVAGFVILDGEQEFSYVPLSEEDAEKLKIGQEELENFNQEIDQVNAVVEHVSVQLSEMENPTKEDSINIWKDVKDSLSPEAFSALQKVTAQLYK